MRIKWAWLIPGLVLVVLGTVALAADLSTADSVASIVGAMAAVLGLVLAGGSAREASGRPTVLSLFSSHIQVGDRNVMLAEPDKPVDSRKPEM